MTEPNLDKQIQYILNSLIRKRSISDNYDGIENATLDIQDILANQVREARLDGQLMALNSFYNSGEISSDSYKLSVKQIADRIAELNKEATQ